MADYYPLIARAVAGLDKNTGDGRRALYERARTALVAQLRSVNPPLSENDVTRERLALEESIRKVEAEAARKGWVDPGNGAAPTRVRAPEFPRWDPPPPSAPDDDEPPRHAAETNTRHAPPSRGEGVNGRPASARSLRASNVSAAPAPNGMRGEHERYADPVFDQPLPSEQAPNMPPRPATARTAKPSDRRSLQDAGLKNFRDGVSDNGEDNDPLPRVVKNGPRENGPMPPTSHDFDRIDARSYDPHGAPMSDYPAQPMLEQGPDYEDEPRPLPAKARAGGATGGPAVARASRRSFGEYVRIALTLLILAGLGGVIVWQWPNMASLYRSARAPATAPQVAGDSQPTTTRPAKVTERFGQSGDTPTAAPAAPAPNRVAVAPPTGPAASGATVAQKVVLYEEDPTDPNGKQFVGSAIWRVERVPPSGPGQPEEVAIRADVEIPDRKLTMTWSLRRNTDQSLPASHTVEILFKLPQDFPPGSVTNVPGILMKQTEQTRGAPLAGHAVKVTDSYYLIGLSSFDADRENNLRMLKERGWFDIPVVYSNKRRAILAVEKGTPGDRAFAEAFAAWRQ
ncbi:MAG: hypothetical protein K2Y71_01330 [Xanthobacteraceae bacterium]|nr:hypothetical protein [Xanthobacteraceae bacterium]